MKLKRWLKCALAPLALAVIAAPASAQWAVDEAHSSLDFISTKNAAVAERHHFTSVTGSVSADGQLSIAIALDSVETLIDIRNERMREKLFETLKFPLAEATAQVDLALLALEPGQVRAATIPLSLSLHGHSKKLNAAVVVSSDDQGRLWVVTAHPVIVNAADFGLSEGLAVLQGIAGLQSIADAVPVSFSLRFTPAGE